MSFAVVYKTHDPIVAEMIGDVLSQNNIAARVFGTRHAALVGVAQSIMELRVEVPFEQTKTACELIDAFFAATPVAAPDEESEEAEDADDLAEPRPASAAKPRSHLLALGSAFVVFGGSHFYARRSYTAAIIAAGEIVGLFLFFQGGTAEQTLGVVLWWGLFACDLCFAQLAVRAHNLGEMLGRGREIVRGLALVLVVLGLGALAVQNARPAQSPVYVPLRP